MVYPIGGGLYRFVDKLEFISTGTLKTIFSVPVATSEFQSAIFNVRYFTNGNCTTDWCTASMTTNNTTSANCCISSSSSFSSSSSSSSSSFSSSESFSSSSSYSSSSSSSSFSAQPKGGCCLFINNAYHCTEVTEYNCSLIGGAFLGVGVTCSDSPCSSTLPQSSTSFSSSSSSISSSSFSSSPSSSSSRTASLSNAGWEVAPCNNLGTIYWIQEDWSQWSQGDIVVVSNTVTGHIFCAKLIIRIEKTESTAYATYAYSQNGDTYLSCSVCHTTYGL